MPNIWNIATNSCKVNFDKAKHLNEQYLKEKNDLIQERSDLACLAEWCMNEYTALLKQKLELEQVNKDLELTVEQQDIKMQEMMDETKQVNTADKVNRLTASVSHLVAWSQAIGNTACKHAEMIAQEARSVATAMQAKEVALTEGKTEIASLRNQIKKGKYKSQLTVNNNYDANDKSPEPTPGASSLTTSIPSDNHSIHDLITDTLAQFMAANPSLHASPLPSMPKCRRLKIPI
ncbi:hypothetical protein BT96DRAFT_1005537 [Gymnopus androsaceus JB14]|uniref:Uncharacterized protein n=1 Tax=Gymnopus androsaceus JB14 TaxID=1447944 RepID=A0A6A4GNU4_9AGAR|nr:hypothetical protein BT96DRAFT_1005537 [Gymnopus androsaceus JB14]